MAAITATVVERTGPGIRAALDERAPGERLRFEAELREALVRAGEDLDVAPVQEVLTRWHARASVVANPLSDDEQELVARARAGDFAGLRSRDEHGAWTTL